MTEPKILLALAQQLSHDTFRAGRKTNPNTVQVKISIQVKSF